MTRYVMCVLKWLATSNHTKTTRNYLENPLKPSEIIPNLFGSNYNFQKSKVWNISDGVILWRYYLLKLSFCLGQNLLESKLPIKKDVFFWRHKVFSQSLKKKKKSLENKRRKSWIHLQGSSLFELHWNWIRP